MASPHWFHERDSAVSDTVPRAKLRKSQRHPIVHAFRPLAVSCDSMVKMAS